MIITTRKEKNRLIVEISAILLCIMQSFAFAQPDSPFYSRSLGLLYLSLLLFPFFYITIAGTKYLKIRLESLLLSFSVFIYWFYEYIHAYGNLNVTSFFFFIFIFPFCFLKNDLQAEIFILFKKILYCMSICGILISLLYIFNILSPFSIVEFYDNAESNIKSYYANYYIGYIQITEYGLMRLCGLFNEPGLFGTLAALTLISDRMKMDKYNITILIACLFTFSAACFALLILYFIFRVLLSRNYKSIFILFIFITSFVYLTTLEFEDTNLKMFFQRFSFQGGGLIADNRTTSAFESLWKQILEDPGKLWFGYGRALPELSSSTYKIFILKHGIIGTFIIFFPVLIVCYKLSYRNKAGFLLVLLFFISIYQRPQIFNLAFFVVLFGGLQYLRMIKKNVVQV